MKTAPRAEAKGAEIFRSNVLKGLLLLGGDLAGQELLVADRSSGRTDAGPDERALRQADGFDVVALLAPGAK